MSARTVTWAHPLAEKPYDRRPSLSPGERRALARLASCQGHCPRDVLSALERLGEPIDDALAFIGRSSRSSEHRDARRVLMTAMHREGRAFWGFDHECWASLVRGTDDSLRQAVIGIGYLLCGERDLHRVVPRSSRRKLVRRLFGSDAVDASLGRAVGHLDSFGYRAKLGRPALASALYELMLHTGSPLLEDIAADPEAFVSLHARGPATLRDGTSQLARALGAMGVLERSPFPEHVPDAEWLDRCASSEGAPEEWVAWVRRWFLTSTLARRSREGSFYRLVIAGRWIAAEGRVPADPAAWTRASAAEWVARVDRMAIGEFSRSPNTDYHVARSDGQLGARSKRSYIYELRRFFSDLQEWEWIARRFDPVRAFAIPRSIAALIGPDPRVIADETWAKLMWAGLNLTAEDLPQHATAEGQPWYPLELVRAVALLWLFGGLRVSEIMRLRTGAVRLQSDGNGAAQGICLLDLPVTKTSTAYTKPIDRSAGEAIRRFEAISGTQPRQLDPKTGERVSLLFCWRGAPIGTGYVNRVLIPLLCRKAGVPRADVRGTITSHRARATIASQLYNAKDPMSLFELQEWLGHRSPSSTQHYARLTPTTLAKAYSDAGYFERNLRTISVLLDRDAIGEGAAATGEPYEFYDLGHGYCGYSFFEQCPHRMACARCDFYVPKDSSRAQLLEAKSNLQRMLVEIPLTDGERAAVEGDDDAVSRLIETLTDTPTPAGPTPRALKADARPEAPRSADGGR